MRERAAVPRRRNGVSSNKGKGWHTAIGMGMRPRRDGDAGKAAMPGGRCSRSSMSPGKNASGAFCRACSRQKAPLGRAFLLERRAPRGPWSADPAR
eukprot:3308944-Pleurochrysis_carterae.AAC.1